jgi:glycosyltransferase involved in cell wall biosynthesis
MKIHGKFIEKRIFKKLHCFITVNKSLLNYFDKIYHIPNSLIIMNFPYLKSQTKIEKIDFRKKYNWEGKSVIFIYQGVLNYGRGIKLFIKSLSITNNRYKLVILGDGPIKNEISTLINELNLENRVKTIPMVSLNKYLNYTSAADFGLNLLEPINKSKEFASPNKLFEYIHRDKPVLCSNTYENKLVIEKYNVGLMTENSMEEISKNIVKLSQDNNIVKKEFNLAKNEFNWERQEKKLLEIIL